MQSRKEGRNYLIQFYDLAPRKINRRLTDKLLQQAGKHLDALINIYKTAIEKEYSLTYLISLTDDIETFVEKLEAERKWIKDSYELVTTHQDEIRQPETYLDFEDLGYKWNMGFSQYKKTGFPQCYTKTIEDTDEKNVEEEIWIFEDGEISRRIRTTLWDIVEYGKSSRSITYKKLRVTKKIKLAAANLLKYGDKVEV